MNTSTLSQLVQKVIDEAPQGPNTDFGVLLNRLIKVSPGGIKIRTLRSQLRYALL